MDKDTTQAKLYEHYLGFFLPEGMLDFFELVWLALECRFCALCPANPLRLRSMCRPRNIHPSVETAVSGASFGFLQDKAVELRYLSTSPKANANQLYAVRLAIAGKDAGVAPGMNAMVKVYSQDVQTEGMAVPASAIFSDGGKSCVWLLSGEVVAKRTVEVDDLRSDGTMTILSGIAAGDVIVTAGVHKLVEEQAVKRSSKKPLQLTWEVCYEY